MAGTYDHLVNEPPRMQLTVNDDGRMVFDGRFVREQFIGFDLNMGLQFIRWPFKGDNPPHTHNFQEFLAWYSGDPDDPDTLGGEVHFFLGEEQEEYIITKPTIITLPPGLVHCPMEIVRVDRPFIQLEVMLPPPAGEPRKREPFLEADKDVDPYDLVTINYLNQ